MNYLTNKPWELMVSIYINEDGTLPNSIRIVAQDQSIILSDKELSDIYEAYIKEKEKRSNK